MKIRKKTQSAGLVATVVNSLESDSEVDGLSAKQGKVLKEMIEGTILYENQEGTKGNVTLSDIAENYDYIEVYYKTDNRTGSVKVKDFTDKKIVLSIMASSSSTIVIVNKDITISGTTITQEKACQYFNNTSNANQYTEVDDIYITKVIGYK